MHQLDKHQLWRVRGHSKLSGSWIEVVSVGVSSRCDDILLPGVL